MTDLRAAILARCAEIEHASPMDSGYTSVLPEWEDLVAGAREMVEVHQPHLRDWAMRWERGRREQIGLGPACEGCGFDPVDEAWRHSTDSCPSLRATARMLGVAVTGG